MASAFSFGFGGDDIEVDDEASVGNALERGNDTATTLESLPVRRHDLEELLSTIPSCLSYNYLDIPLTNQETSPNRKSQYGDYNSIPNANTLRIPRRDLFDIRAQLMAESSPDENNNDDLISGLDTGDLTSGFYEGGFKTWECAVDLAALVAQQMSFQTDKNWHIIELGAGSAIPTLSVFSKVFSRTRLDDANFRFVFSDYNEEVLRLVSLPNVLLTWWEARANAEASKSFAVTADLDDIDEVLTRKFVEECKNKGISFDFVSGAWGPDFVELVAGSSRPASAVREQEENTIILASETVYSPSSLKSFSDTVLDLLKRARGPAKALVAAKQIYFGVGGGVPEFVHEMQNVGGLVKEVANITSGGVGRVILEITLARAP